MRLFSLLLIPLFANAAAASDIPHPTPLPGGFVDTTGQIGIFNTPGGGIQAIKLSTGESFWQSNQAQRPLFIADNRLYALASVQVLSALPRNGFRLVAFDLADSGKIVLESETVAFPEWALIAEAHDRS